jgi:hypothetical protein
MRLSVWVDIFGDDIVVTAMVGRLEHLTRTRARKCTVRVFPHAGHGLLDFPPTDPRAANALSAGWTGRSASAGRIRSAGAQNGRRWNRAPRRYGQLRLVVQGGRRRRGAGGGQAGSAPRLW